MVSKWLRDVDKLRKWKKASPPSTKQSLNNNMMSSSQSARGHQRVPVRNAAAIVRDVCEMSISLDASNSKWDMNEMSLSRSHNPFTSSGTFTGSVSGAGGFGFAPGGGGGPGRGGMGPPSHLPSSHHHNMNGSHSYSSASSGYSHPIQHNNNHRRPLQAHKKIPTMDEYEEDFEQVDPYDHDQEFKQYEDSRRGSRSSHQEEKKSSSSSKYPRK